MKRGTSGGYEDPGTFGPDRRVVCANNGCLKKFDFSLKTKWHEDSQFSEIQSAQTVRDPVQKKKKNLTSPHHCDCGLKTGLIIYSTLTYANMLNYLYVTA